MQSGSDAAMIGVLIGDVIVRRGGFQWLSADDQYGIEPVVCHNRKVAYIAPISAVLKRFERREPDFDVAELTRSLRQTCVKLAANGEAADLPANLRR